MALSFGEKIRNARKAKHLTQKTLAGMIGAAHNSISDWENNKNKPDPDTIELLCGVLDITPNYLLEKGESHFSPKERLLIKKYRALDEHGTDMVDTVLDKEYDRCCAEDGFVPLLNAAHERIDIDASEDMKRYDEEIMDDPDF